MYFSFKFAKILAFIVLSLALQGCQKKSDVPGHAPEFQFGWVGLSSQDKSGSIFVKRTGTSQENPKLQVRMPKDSTERLLNRHMNVSCDSQEIFNKVEAVTDIQFEYSISKEIMPLLESLPKVTNCKAWVRVYNEEGSSHTESLDFILIQDSEAPHEVVDETPSSPVVATAFLLKNIRIKNTGQLSEKFFAKQSLHYDVQKIFFFDPSQNGSQGTYRLSADWVKAVPYKVLIDNVELTADINGYYVFEIKPQQEVRLQFLTALPGGSCPADRLVSAVAGNITFPDFLPRHYKGGVVRIYETDFSLMQFETSENPLSDLVRSRRGFVDNTVQVGANGQYIRTMDHPISTVGMSNVLPMTYFPNVGDCSGILPDRVR